MILLSQLLQVSEGTKFTLYGAYIFETLKIFYIGFKPLWEVGTKAPLLLTQTRKTHNTASSTAVASVETWKVIPDDLMEDDLVNEDDLLNSSEPPPSKHLGGVNVTDCSTKRRACKVL